MLPLRFMDDLLARDEPPPILECGSSGASNFLIVVDHASARIPRALGTLGLPAAELERHIAWDIGSLAVARELGEVLDAGVIAQNYSRLVIDCNRDPRVASSIVQLAEHTPVPGNVSLTPAQVAARRREIFDPYHERIRAVLDARRAAGRATILVAQHTMTDVFKGVRRPMHAAVLYSRDRRFAGPVLEALRREAGLVIGDNEPYFLSDETDYTIPHHAEARGLLHVEIEVRQDLVRDAPGQRAWAQRLSAVLREAERHCL
jgi:predicted N-formylglutamate amidohydrolase